MFTSEEILRYQRHFSIKNWDEKTQFLLKKSSVFVAGSGGLGSPVLYYLAAAGVGKIFFCDRDIVDLSNLNRQILYNINDIGIDKVYAAETKLSQLNNTVNLIPLKRDIDNNISDVIGDCDLIIDCLDNFEARHILNRISVERDIPMIHAGVTEFYSQVTFLKPGETPCLSCFINENTASSGKGIIGAMAGITGSIQAMEAIKYLTGTGELLLNKLLFIDMKHLSFNTMKISRNPGCSICSKK